MEASKTETEDIKNQEWSINSNTTEFNLLRITELINDATKGKGGINLKPFYQREYKFTRKDESLLIESILGGIPVPVIYLASNVKEVPNVFNVIDGQHRLMAIDRFLNNKFSLIGLEQYDKLNNKKFDELDITTKNTLMYQRSLVFRIIHIQDDPSLELEIFKRYNQGSNQLTGQEIRQVIFNSKFNELMIELLEKWKKIPHTKEIFNMTKVRFNNKSIHQEFYVMYSIYKNFSLEKNNTVQYGINEKNFSSTKYVDQIMPELKKVDDLTNEDLFRDFENVLKAFVSFLKKVYYDAEIKHPLSKAIFGRTDEARNYKMQVSILMIVFPVFCAIRNNEQYDLSLEDSKKEIAEKIKKGFINSEFPENKGSSTEPKLLIGTIEKILFEFQ